LVLKAPLDAVAIKSKGPPVRYGGELAVIPFSYILCLFSLSGIALKRHVLYPISFLLYLHKKCSPWAQYSLDNKSLDPSISLLPTSVVCSFLLLKATLPGNQGFCTCSSLTLAGILSYYKSLKAKSAF
jgi:hypothetical protein